MNTWVHPAAAGAEWTRGLIARIEAGAYTFAGEGEPFVGVLSEGQEGPFATGLPDPDGAGPLWRHVAQRRPPPWGRGQRAEGRGPGRQWWKAV